jgi:hypothetical protein
MTGLNPIPTSPETSPAERPLSASEAKRLATRAEIARSRFYPYWRKHYAFSDDAGEKRKQLPWLPYHQFLAAVLASGKRRIGIDKSRQMQTSWDICAYLLWYAMFVESTEIIVCSKVQRDTDYLLERMETLWRNQPEFLRDYAPVNFTDPEAFALNTRSKIIPLPEGADPVRGTQGNVVFLDECGHMEGFMNRYTAALPQINRPVNPGKIILAGTPNLHGDWWRVVKDKYQ